MIGAGAVFPDARGPCLAHDTDRDRLVRKATSNTVLAFRLTLRSSQPCSRSASSGAEELDLIEHWRTLVCAHEIAPGFAIRCPPPMLATDAE
jgi:hypothetical protein